MAAKYREGEEEEVAEAGGPPEADRGAEAEAEEGGGGGGGEAQEAEEGKVLRLERDLLQPGANRVRPGNAPRTP